MYVTDYYYAASSSAWTLVGYVSGNDPTKDYRAAKDIDWLNLRYVEWTITRRSAGTGDAFSLSNGYLDYDSVYNHRWNVRPSFNLLSSVTYASGLGSMSDPIRIN